MAEFSYSAVDASGQEFIGKLNVDSMAELRRVLEQEGKRLVFAKAQKKSRIKFGGKKKWSPKRSDMVELLTQVDSQYRAGIPLAEIFADMVEDTKDEKLKQAIRLTVADMQSGNPFAESAKKHGLVDGMAANILHAGEETGSMEKSFDMLIKYYEWMEELDGLVTQASIYPIAVIFTLILFVVIIFGFVIPKMMVMFTTMHTTLPLPTQMLVSMSNFFSKYLLYILGAIFLAPVAFIMAIRQNDKFHLFVDKHKLRLPIFGNVMSMVALSRMTHVMESIMASGMGVAAGFKIAGGACGNMYYERAMTRAIAAIEDGENVTSALKRTEAFPNMILKMVASGERGGQMEEAFAFISSYYDKIVPRKTKTAISMLEPLILLVLGGIVLFVALGIVMPMSKMINAL